MYFIIYSRISQPPNGIFPKKGVIILTVTGIICEYNPLHLGHQKQLDAIRALRGDACGIVCLMSGNFVQRGAPAIVDKGLRAKAAVLCGADLVLELPVTAALSSAEGFASEGVRLLSPFCDTLCFGAETADAQRLTAAAEALLSSAFPAALRRGLDKGLSFPAARQAALSAMGMDASILSQPNNILAVEYCKAILRQHSAMQPLPIPRQGNYHAAEADRENPSATSIRALMTAGEPWDAFVPAQAQRCFLDTPLHTLSAGERAMLGRLRSMTDAEFEALPYSSEGLWRKLMHAARREGGIDAIAEAVKSKRYTRSRIDRMLLCAFLGLTRRDMAAPAPYARVLAFNDRGREILKAARKKGDYPNIGENISHPFQQTEYRVDDLYGLFAVGAPSPAGQEPERRVYYCK